MVETDSNAIPGFTIFKGTRMKRIFVAAFCTLLMSSSLLAQEAAKIEAPVAPVEDVAVDEAVPVAPVAEAAAGTFVVTPQAAGCSNCGRVVARSLIPMTFTRALTPRCCPQVAAPAPTCCAAPAPTCCDPCARKSLIANLRAKVGSRRAGRTCCY